MEEIKMKIGEATTITSNVSQVRGNRAFMASKQIRSWRRNGGKPSFPITKNQVKSMIIEKTITNDAAADEANDGSHIKYCEARPPPQFK